LTWEKGYYRFEGNNYPLEVKTLPEKAGIEMVLIPPGEFTMGTPLSAEAWTRMNLPSTGK